MRVLIVGAAVAAISAGCAGAKEAKSAPPPPRLVEVLELVPSDVRETGEYLGTLSTRKNVTVVPQVTGYVRRIHVRPGQRVQAGQTLVEIDARQESAALASVEAQRRSADANLSLAKQTAARSESLYREGLISAQELERARAQAQSAEAASKAVSAQVSQRQVQLGFFAVRAPFEGTAGDVLVRLGDFVTASTPVTTIAESDVLEVSVGVPAARARGVRPGSVVEVLDDAGKVLVASEAFFVAPQANPRTQLVEVKAAFRNAAGMRPNELVRARVVFSTRKALQIPALAVTRQSGQAFALAVAQKDGAAVVEKKPITLGALGAESYVVEGGLNAGALVAVSSLQYLRDGTPIQMKRVAPAARAAGDTAGGPVEQSRSGR